MVPASANFREVTQDEFNNIIASYVDPSLVPGDYFTDSRVILIYDGELDPCSAHLEFNGGVSLGTVTDTSVKVILSYTEKAKDDKCSAQPINPFAFYQIKTKKLLVLEQKITQ